jgi:hypothetical protein
MVDHGHKYAIGEVKEYMHVHVYHEGVGKKEQTTWHHLLWKHWRGCCSGQNKNNTVLKLAAWLKGMGYFGQVNFIFLFVGHTKNAADCLFNSLEHEYQKQDIFTMEVLIEKLSYSDCVTIMPTVSEDFFNYNKLFKELY